MQVIAVLNQKGGSGKTTIATHLARAFQLDSHDVLLVDSDPQGSARDWAAVREDQPVPVVGLDRPTIDRDLKSIARKEYVIINWLRVLQTLLTSCSICCNSFSRFTSPCFL